MKRNEKNVRLPEGRERSDFVKEKRGVIDNFPSVLDFHIHSVCRLGILCSIHLSYGGI
jgi:hypothetical protein